MKAFQSLFVVVLFIISGCSESSNPIENSDDGSLKISGLIKDYERDFVQVYIPIDSSTVLYGKINSDGIFRLDVPLPKENQLYTYTPKNYIKEFNGSSSSLTDEIIIHNPKLKYFRYDFSAGSKGPLAYSLPINLSNIDTKQQPVQVGDYFITYYYFDTSTRITGKTTWEGSWGNDSKIVQTVFNVKTKIGWNRLLTKYESHDHDKIIYEVTDIKSAQDDWVIGASNRFSNVVHKF